MHYRYLHFPPALCNDILPLNTYRQNLRTHLISSDDSLILVPRYNYSIVVDIKQTPIVCNVDAVIRVEVKVNRV